MGFFDKLKSGLAKTKKSLVERVETVLLNYMALHGEQGQFMTKFPSSSLGGSAMLDRLTAFAPVVNGTI